MKLLLTTILALLLTSCSNHKPTLRHVPEIDLDETLPVGTPVGGIKQVTIAVHGNEWESPKQAADLAYNRCLALMERHVERQIERGTLTGKELLVIDTKIIGLTPREDGGVTFHYECQIYQYPKELTPQPKPAPQQIRPYKTTPRTPHQLVAGEIFFKKRKTHYLP